LNKTLNLLVTKSVLKTTIKKLITKANYFNLPDWSSSKICLFMCCC